jgi:hypothetical protein
MGSPKFETDELELHMKEAPTVEANQTSMGSPKFKSEGLELQMKKALTVEVIAKSFVHVLGTSSPHDIEKMLGGAPPKDNVQEAMETHEPFGSSMFVSIQPVNAALKLGSIEIQTSTVASHVEESAPPRKKLRRAIGFLTYGAHAIGPTTRATPYSDIFPRLKQGGNC